MRFLLSTIDQTLLLVLTTLVVQAQTIYVTPAGGGDQSGSSWSNALSGTALQGQLAAAPAGSIFRLAGGVYKPTATTDRTVSFSIPSGVQVYGGYVAGTDTRVTNRSSTTLSG